MPAGVAAATTVAAEAAEHPMPVVAVAAEHRVPVEVAAHHMPMQAAAHHISAVELRPIFPAPLLIMRAVERPEWAALAVSLS